MLYDRYLVRMEEMVQSCGIVGQALDNLPDGPVSVEDNKITMPHKSDAYGHIEGLIHHFKIVMDGHGVQPPIGRSLLRNGIAKWRIRVLHCKRWKWDCLSH